MKLTGIIARSLQADMQAELRDLERAVSDGTREAGRGLRTEPRRQVASAGLGQRLANSWRDRHYPNQKLDAASLVYTKAPQIIRAFDEGVVIRSRRGHFLAIPTENAPRNGTDGKRVSPSTFPEHRFGPLRFVPRPSGPSLLLMDVLHASFSRKSGERRPDDRCAHRADRRAFCRHHADRPRGRRHPGGPRVRLHLVGTVQARPDGTRGLSAQPKLAVEGPGGVQASFDFRGAKNTAVGRMLTVTLTNDLDGTVYL